MSDLCGQVLLQKGWYLRRIELWNRINGNVIAHQQMLMRFAHGNERGRGSDALNMGMRQKFQGIRKRIVPSGKDMTVRRPGHQADVVEGDVALVDQAKRGLGLV